MSLFITEEYEEHEVQYLIEQLNLFNKNTAPTEQESYSEPFNLVLKDQDGRIYGGVIGLLYRFALYINILWVSDDVRGQGYGSQLLREIEDKAKLKGCKLIHLDTWNFQAPEFYRKQGFEVFGTLEGFPEGFSRIFLRKELK